MPRPYEGRDAETLKLVTLRHAATPTRGLISMLIINRGLTLRIKLLSLTLLYSVFDVPNKGTQAGLGTFVD